MRYALTAIVLPLLLAAPASAEDKAPERLISVTGQGEIFAKPDRGHISVGVAAEGKTAAEALGANSEDMRKVIEALKAEGIEPRDIQTSNLSIDPIYTTPKEGERAELAGYRASNNVSVTIRNLTKMGDILDSAVSLGANEVGGVSFSVSDADKRLDEARRAAIEDAMRKATLLAEAAGAKLGPVQSISESSYAPQPRPYMARAVAMEAAAPPVETGEQALSVNVSVTWKLE